MKCSRALAVAGALACGLLAAPAAATWTLNDVARTYQDSTVFIEADVDGQPFTQGSGVIVSDQGHVLTAWHVLLSCHECRKSGTTYWATIGGKPKSREDRIRLVLRGEDAQRDLALFELETGGKRGKRAPIGKRVSPPAQLFVLGFPGISDYTPYPGTLGNDTQPDGRWHTSLIITEGNSGGPVFDTNGTLVGIALRGLKGEEGMKTVAPIWHAEALLGLAKVSLPEGSGKQEAELIGVFIDDSKLTGSTESVETVKALIARLSMELPGMRLIGSREKALYTLTLLNLRPQAETFLFLTASFGKAGESEQPAVGKCFDGACTTDRQGPVLAFKHLLENTLLHPTKGFYRHMRIEACPWLAYDRGLMSLELQWKEGPGLSDVMIYEVGEIRGKEEAVGFGLYVTVDEPPESREDKKAKARFRKLRGSTSYSVRACENTGPATGNEVLMVRMLQRSTEDATRNPTPKQLR